MKLNKNSWSADSVSELQLFWTAIMFYSRIPTPPNLPFSTEALNLSRKYFPLVGIIVATIASIALWVSAWLLPISIAVLLSMIASILATGAFHEDGFADSCDGLGGGWKADQVLSIMKDSRLGTYGAIGLFMMLSLKFFCLYSLANLNIELTCLALLFTHTLSRLLSSSIIDLYDYVQDINKSKVKPITESRMDKGAWTFSLLLSKPPIAAMVFAYPIAIFSIIPAAVSSIAFAQYCKKRIGGYTGDVLGAIQQISEVLVYLALIGLLL